MRGHPDRVPGPDGRELAAVFAGGALGTLARVGLAEAFPHAPAAWPWPTLAVNLVGAFALGWAVTRMAPGSWHRPFVGIGVCGGLTTFSTFQLELLRMLEAGRWPLALAYAVVSLTAGLAAVRLGIRAARGEGART